MSNRKGQLRSMHIRRKQKSALRRQVQTRAPLSLERAEASCAKAPVQLQSG